jgi:hypothetical protein
MRYGLDYSAMQLVGIDPPYGAFTVLVGVPANVVVSLHSAIECGLSARASAMRAYDKPCEVVKVVVGRSADISNSLRI